MPDFEYCHRWWECQLISLPANHASTKFFGKSLTKEYEISSF